MTKTQGLGLFSTRRRQILAIAATAVFLLLVAAPALRPLIDQGGPGASQAVAPTVRAVGLLPSTNFDTQPQSAAAEPIEVGLRFTPKVTGQATGVHFYKAWRSAKDTPSTASLWSGNKRIADVRIATQSGPGWIESLFGESVTLKAGRTYTVSVFAPLGRYSTAPGAWSGSDSEFLQASADSGVTGLQGEPPTTAAARNYLVDVIFQPGVTSPITSEESSWPGPENTGAPDESTLTTYTGPCTITKTVRIQRVDARACDALLIQAPKVKISHSLLPRIDATQGSEFSVKVSHSTVEGGDWVDGAVWGDNITLRAVEVTGGQHSVHCGTNCTVTDSWLHQQYNPDGQSYHNNAFLSNGGTKMLVRHNTLHCDAILNATDGGCTGNLALFGDFGPIDDVIIDGNLFVANNSSISYCLYAGYSASKPHPRATEIVVANNVFERGDNRKCGVYGPITGYERSADGNLWANNDWVDGRVVKPTKG